MHVKIHRLGDVVGIEFHAGTVDEFNFGFAAALIGMIRADNSPPARVIREVLKMQNQAVHLLRKTGAALAATRVHKIGLREEYAESSFIGMRDAEAFPAGAG